MVVVISFHEDTYWWVIPTVRTIFEDLQWFSAEQESVLRLHILCSFIDLIIYSSWGEKDQSYGTYWRTEIATYIFLLSYYYVFTLFHGVTVFPVILNESLGDKCFSYSWLCPFTVHPFWSCCSSGHYCIQC